jgi:hypothetical protein
MHSSALGLGKGFSRDWPRVGVTGWLVSVWVECCFANFKGKNLKQIVLLIEYFILHHLHSRSLL